MVRKTRNKTVLRTVGLVIIALIVALIYQAVYSAEYSKRDAIRYWKKSGSTAKNDSLIFVEGPNITITQVGDSIKVEATSTLGTDSTWQRLMLVSEDGTETLFVSADSVWGTRDTTVVIGTIIYGDSMFTLAPAFLIDPYDTALASDKYLYAGIPDSNKALRYNHLTAKWQFNNGGAWTDMGSGGSGSGIRWKISGGTSTADSMVILPEGGSVKLRQGNGTNWDTLAIGVDSNWVVAYLDSLKAYSGTDLFIGSGPVAIFYTTTDSAVFMKPIRIKEASGDKSIGLFVPNISADANFYLPPNMGTNGYVLKTDGTDSTYWAVDAGGGGATFIWGVSGQSTTSDTLIIKQGNNVTLSYNDQTGKDTVTITSAAAGDSSWILANVDSIKGYSGSSIFIGSGTTSIFETFADSLNVYKTLRIKEASGDKSIGVRVPNISADAYFYLPPTMGSNGQVLTTNGTDSSYWSSVAGGGGAVIFRDSLYKYLDTAKILYSKIDTTSATIPVATRSDSSLAFTHQGIKKWHVDSTSMNFVFDDAYMGTSAQAESLLATWNAARKIAHDSVYAHIGASTDSSWKAIYVDSVLPYSGTTVGLGSGADVLDVEADSVVAHKPVLIKEASNDKSIALKVSNISANDTLVLPPNMGTSGQVLTTNGNDSTYWSTVAGGGGSVNVRDSLYKYVDTLKTLYSKIDTTSAKIPTASLSDSTVKYDTANVVSWPELRTEIKNGAEIYNKIDTTSAKINTSALADSSLAFTHQGIKKYHVDSTAMDFVFDDVYMGTSAQAESLLTTWNAARKIAHDSVFAHLGEGGSVNVRDSLYKYVDTLKTLYSKIDTTSAKIPTASLSDSTVKYDTLNTVSFAELRTEIKLGTEIFNKIDTTLAKIPTASLSDSTIKYDTANVVSWPELRTEIKAGAEIYNKIDTTSATIPVATRSDSTDLITHQNIKKWHVDSTSMNFVFDDAYMGTSAVTDSLLATINFAKKAAHDSVFAHLGDSSWLEIHADNIVPYSGTTITFGAGSNIFDVEADSVVFHKPALIKELSNVHSITLVSPNISANDTVYLPPNMGTNGYVLFTNGVDSTYWAAEIGDIQSVGVTAPITGGGTSGAITVGFDWTWLWGFVDTTTATVPRATLSDSTNLITHQSLKKYHVDSTSANFVFNDAYRVTSVTVDSMLSTIYGVRVIVEDSLDNYWTSTATTNEIKNGAEIYNKVDTTSAKIPTASLSDSTVKYDTLNTVNWTELRTEIKNGAEIYNKIDTTSAKVNTAALSDSTVKYDTLNTVSFTELRTEIKNGAEIYNKIDTTSAKVNTSALSDSALAFTHQGIKKWHVDSTAMNFVFDDAYMGTSAQAESLFATWDASRKVAHDTLWGGGGITSNEIVNQTIVKADVDSTTGYTMLELILRSGSLYANSILPVGPTDTVRIGTGNGIIIGGGAAKYGSGITRDTIITTLMPEYAGAVLFTGAQGDTSSRQLTVSANGSATDNTDEYGNFYQIYDASDTTNSTYQRRYIQVGVPVPNDADSIYRVEIAYRVFDGTGTESTYVQGRWAQYDFDSASVVATGWKDSLNSTAYDTLVLGDHKAPVSQGGIVWILAGVTTMDKHVTWGRIYWIRIIWHKLWL